MSKVNLKAQNRIFIPYSFTKLFAFILVFCMMFCVTARADSTITYVDDCGHVQTVEEVAVIIDENTR